MRHSPQVVVAGAYHAASLDAALIRNVKRKSGNFADRRFLLMAFFSIFTHLVFIFYIRSKEIAPVKAAAIEDIPERFAKLIIEKPIPKTEPVKKTAEPGGKEGKKPEETFGTKTDAPEGPVTPKEHARVLRDVDRRVARVEEKIRTVGVLGMLTGMGPTAKGPAVVDVLGSLKDRRESSVDLEAALEQMTGLQKTKNIEVLGRKLVKSKDISISHKEDIDDLLANARGVTTVDLAKKGSFIIQKPESIEGAASSNAKRDNDAINAIVSSHKASIRMSYEKYLKRDPVLAGKITVRFTIAASGNVAMATIVNNTTGNKELEEEILRKIRMWRFEVIPDGDVTVTYPFVFAPAS
ncbi:MAG: energy transducer TonB [Chitinispirillaceae bacterium]|nr:energy transducer TonB [Chitinispirillaceae bacterium]